MVVIRPCLYIGISAAGLIITKAKKKGIGQEKL
jgi:hypothetical protein